MRVPTQRVRELRRSQTDAEEAAWHLLRGRKLGAKFRRQYRIENWVVDFYCFEHRLAIELDGGVHSQPSQMRKDAAKEDYLRSLGIGLLRIPNGLVLEDPEEFVCKVREAIGVMMAQVGPRRASDPSPGPRRLVKAPVAVHPLPWGEGKGPFPILSPRERGRSQRPHGCVQRKMWDTLSPGGEGGAKRRVRGSPGNELGRSFLNTPYVNSIAANARFLLTQF